MEGQSFPEKIFAFSEILPYLYIPSTIPTNICGLPAVSRAQGGGSEGHFIHEVRKLVMSLSPPGCGGCHLAGLSNHDPSGLFYPPSTRHFRPDPFSVQPDVFSTFLSWMGSNFGSGKRDFGATNLGQLTPKG